MGVNCLQMCFLYCSANAAHFICFKSSFAGPARFTFTKQCDSRVGMKSYVYKQNWAVQGTTVFLSCVYKSSDVKRALFLCF